MSATQDKGQKVKFIHSNLYEIHGNRGGSVKAHVVTKANPIHKKSPAVLKAGEMSLQQSSPMAALQVKKYEAAEMLGKRFERPVYTPPTPASKKENNLALEDLKQNLKTLNELQARLRFVLQELEDLVHE